VEIGKRMAAVSAGSTAGGAMRRSPRWARSPASGGVWLRYRRSSRKGDAVTGAASWLPRSRASQR